MIARFNFSSESSPTPNGYILDFGEAYDQRRGYGWITEDSVGSEETVPLSIVGNGRDRDLSAAQLTDTFIHVQYPSQLNTPGAVGIPAAWEFDVAQPGQYRVNVVVGDDGFIDSTHQINIDGEAVINSFEPTETNNFGRFTTVVEVDDRLTVDAIGGDNTKLNFIRFAPITKANINFGLQNSNVPSDYFRDSGAGYSPVRGYGWVNEASQPISVTENALDRGVESNNLLDTFINIQPEDSPPITWVYDIPQGVYQVTISAGDAEFTEGDDYKINIEGQEFLSFTPTADELFASETKLVQVDDGKITLDATGGTNTKINSINIAPVVDVTVNFGTTDTDLADGVLSDVGAGYNNARGYGWIEESSIGDNPVPIDLFGNERDRGVLTGDLSDSLMHMQYPDAIQRAGVVRTPSAWEYDLPNGRYEVKVSVGDISYTDSNHVINIEGENVISEFTPTGEGTFDPTDTTPDGLYTMGTTTVDVTDGKLTVDAIGGMNTKINFIEIETLIPDGGVIVPS